MLLMPPWSIFDRVVWTGDNDEIYAVRHEFLETWTEEDQAELEAFNKQWQEAEKNNFKEPIEVIG